MKLSTENIEWCLGGYGPYGVTVKKARAELAALLSELDAARDRHDKAEARVKELEAGTGYRLAAQWRGKCEAAEAEVARLTDWQKGVSVAVQTIPEYATGEWGGDKNGWGWHNELVRWLQRHRVELEREVERLTAANTEASDRLLTLTEERDSLREVLASTEEKVRAARSALRTAGLHDDFDNCMVSITPECCEERRKANIDHAAMECLRRGEVATMKKYDSSGWVAYLSVSEAVLDPDPAVAILRHAGKWPMDVPPPDPATVENARQEASEGKGSTIDEILDSLPPSTPPAWHARAWDEINLWGSNQHEALTDLRDHVLWLESVILNTQARDSKNGGPST